MSEPTPATDPAAGARAYELDRAHVFHSWSAQAAAHADDHRRRRPAPGCGTTTGNRYLDFSSQLVNTNIGHQHPKVIAAIQEQAGILATIAPQHANAARSEAARLIAELAPESMNKVFFTNGGADAIENAIRMARLHTGRRKVLSFYRSYHGNTGAAIVATGDPRRWPNEFADDHVHFFGPYLYRSHFWATTPRAGVASARWSTSPTSSGSRARARSRPSSWRPSWAPPAS